MSKQMAKSFEVRFGERVTIRTSQEIWAKLAALAKSRGQALERLIQEAEDTRPEYIQRPEWLRKVVETRGDCCKYYRHKQGVMTVGQAPISLPSHAPVPVAANPHQVMNHLVENASWHVPVVPMRELNSNEAVEFILSSKLLQASPRSDITGTKGGTYVVLHPDTREPYLCLYNPRGRSFVFELAKMPDRLAHLMEAFDSDFERVAKDTYQLMRKPFPSLRSQLGM